MELIEAGRRVAHSMEQQCKGDETVWVVSNALADALIHAAFTPGVLEYPLTLNSRGQQETIMVSEEVLRGFIDVCSTGLGRLT